MASRMKSLRPSSFCRSASSVASRPSLPSSTLALPSSLNRSPSESLSSSAAGSGHSIAIVDFESLKLRSRFLSDRSSRLRFHISSRSRFCSATGSRRLSRSSSNCGISPTSWAVTVAATGRIARLG